MGRRWTHIIRYEPAPDVEILAKKIAVSAGMELDFSRIHFVRSRGARTRAVARTHGFPRILQFALNMPAHYVVEVVSERFDLLPERRKLEIITHELLHIPKSMGGGLRNHRYVTAERVREIVRRFERAAPHNI